MKSYNISRPMPWCEFKQMPDDLKREFYRNMQSFGGTAKWLAEEMGAMADAIGEKPTREGLIAMLREYAEWGEANIYEVPIMLPDDLRAAADMLEKGE